MVVRLDYVIRWKGALGFVYWGQGGRLENADQFSYQEAIDIVETIGVRNRHLMEILPLKEAEIREVMES
jgi:hypothetical protein